MFHSPLLRHTPNNFLLFFVIELGSVHFPSCLVKLLSFAGATVLENLTILEATVLAEMISHNKPSYCQAGSLV